MLAASLQLSSDGRVSPMYWICCVSPAFEHGLVIGFPLRAVAIAASFQMFVDFELGEQLGPELILISA